MLWCDSGQVAVDDFTLIWSGVPENMPKYAGVGLAVDKLVTTALVSWHPINSRLLAATFQNSLGLLQVSVAYTSTEETSAADKDIFIPTHFL